MNNTNRNIGIDIIKIISVLMILFMHIVGQGGILVESTGVAKIIYKSIQVFSMCSINMFGIASGYLLCTKKFSLKRIFDFFFYIVLITILWLIILIILDDNPYIYFINFIDSLGTTYWYISNYSLILFVFPYINILINNLNKIQYRKLLVLGMIFFSIVPVILTKDLFCINNGYSFLWLFYLYIIGGYLNKQNISINFKQKLMIICTCFLATEILMLITSTYTNILNFSAIYAYLATYSSPFILVSSVLIFCIFKEINFHKNRFIISLANSSLFIYLFHCNVWFYNRMENIFKFIGEYNIIVGMILISIILIAFYIILAALNNVLMPISNFIYSKFQRRIKK